MESKSQKDIIEDLQKQLAQERSKNRTLSEELKQLKDSHARIQIVTENEEEYITNKFMKYLNQLKKEKEDLALKVEQEEEYLTNTLQKKMLAIMQEKVDLENQLEQEEEFIVNKLQKQIQDVNREKKILEKRLESEINDHKYLLKLEGEVITLRDKIQELENGKHDKEDISNLKAENFVLSQKIMREQEKLSKINSENTKLISELEIDDERHYNIKQKRNRSISFPIQPTQYNNNNNNNNNTTQERSITSSPPSLKTQSSNSSISSTSSSQPIPITRSRSSSSASNPCLIVRVLKEGWVKRKCQDNKIEKRYFELVSSGELREYLDETKLSLLSTVNLDFVLDVLETPGTPQFTGSTLSLPNTPSPSSHIGLTQLDILIQTYKRPITTSKEDNSSQCSNSSTSCQETLVLYVDKHESQSWKLFITDLIPIKPVH